VSELVPPTTDATTSAATAEERLLRRRPLVPTERQRAVGDVERGPVTLEVDGEPTEARAGLRQRLGATLRDADPRLITGPRLPIVVLALTSTIATWDDQALAILAPEIRAEFGFSVAFLVLLGSLMGFLNELVALPLGYVADRVSRVWMVRIGSLVANLGSVLQGIAPGAGALIGARVGGGLGAAAVRPASFPLMTDYYEPSARARVFSFLAAGGQLGLVVGPLLVGLVGARYGWRPAVVSLGALASVVSLTTFLLREPGRGVVEREAAGMDPEAAAEAEGETPGFVEAYRTMASITTLRRFWFVAPFTIVAGAGSGTILSVYYAEVFLLGPDTRGVIASVGAALGFVAVLVFGPVGDRMLQTRPARLVMVAVGITLYQAVSFAVLAFAPNPAVAIAVGLPSAIVSTMFFPAQITMISMIVPPRMRGLGLQTAAPWQFLGLLLAPVVTGVAVSTLGLKAGLLFFAIPLLPAAAIIASTAGHIERDIRNARADALAEAELRELREAGASRLLLVRNLDVGYDGVQVLFGVDLDVEQGELLALLGTNGAGKSTLLRAIAGTQDPTAGAIFLDGRDITHTPAWQSAELGVVMMPGGRAVFPDLTVAENLAAAAWLEDDGAEVARRRRQVLAHFPVLRERLDQPAGTLSGGEQQMVALGQALIMQPRLLMIDELSLGLAPAVVEQLLGILREIHATGTTVIVVEQSLNVALSIAERAVFMEKGQVRFDGSTEELLARPDLVRSVFIGAAGGGSTRRRRLASTPDEEALPALAVEDVAVAFGGVRALRGANLSVARGEILGIIGPNGAGKTTLFDVVSGFVAPDRGTVSLEGVDVTALPAHARGQLGLARSFQNARLFPALTVRETIAAFMDRRSSRNPLAAALWLPGVRASERRVKDRVDGLIELLGLEDNADKFVGELSTGSRRIVDVAGVMAQNPKVLLLDEPTSGLAQAETEALGPLMLRIVREIGCAIVLIEHDVPLVSSVSDRMVAMELGRDVVTGTPAEVTSHPDVLRAYLSATEDVLARSGDRMDRITRALELDDLPGADRAGDPTDRT
jgi:ABC-type branched-subunit amino acid transport system ATPase component/MFS family permease